jgi:hypothetical protein
MLRCDELGHAPVPRSESQLWFYPLDEKRERLLYSVRYGA